MKLIFKSLIDNTAAIDGARKKGRWWVAIILGFLALIFALIPTFVNTITVKGSSYLSGNTHGVDYAIQAFVEDAEAHNYKLVVKDAGAKAPKQLEVEGEFSSFTYVRNEKAFAVVKYETTLSGDSIVELDNADYTVIVFTKQSVCLRLVTAETKEVVHTGTWAKAYNKFDVGTDLIAYFGNAYPQTRANLLSFMDKAYNNERIAYTWIRTGIMALVDLGVILLMGFMLWILTRGKANPFRLFTILDAWKIVAWAAIAPAILGIPLAFLIKNLPDVWFPLLLGIRSMWISMKQLRPDGSGYQEPKEVKTVNVK